MNRLRHISDAVAAGTFSTDIDNQQADNYGYDGNGSLQKDLQRDVAFVVNDIHNLPVSVWKASTGQELKYYYEADGSRIRKDAGSTEYYVNGPGGETEVIVKSDETGATHSILGRDNLGQVKRTGSTFTRYYYLKDHLGTIKMTVDASCDTTGYDDYYPYGQQMDGRCYASSADARYKYTSKERDAESGYDYFGARYYDARVGRWLSVDPLAEKFAASNPFNYGLNNPLNRIDPDGRGPELVLAPEAVAGGLIILGGLINAVGAENVGRSIVSAGEWVHKSIGAPGMQLMSTLGEAVVSATSQPPYANSPDITGMQIQTAQQDRTGMAIDQGVQPVQNLESNVVPKQGGVTIRTYPNDHGPAHAHVRGPGNEETKIGHKGIPLKGQPELTPQQRKVVQENRNAIRKALNKIGRANQKKEQAAEQEKKIQK